MGLQQEQACSEDMSSGTQEYWSGDSGFVVSLNSNNAYSSLSRGGWFVKFFAPWCGHCKQMAPAWESLARDVRVQNWDVTIAEVDCTVSQDVCARYGASSFPTIKLFRDGVEQGQYNGDRTANGYHQWLAPRLSR